MDISDSLTSFSRTFTPQLQHPKRNPSRTLAFVSLTRQMYKMPEVPFCTAEEMDLSKDSHDGENELNDNECHFISHILAFFAASDGIINENLVERLTGRFKLPKTAAKIVMENIHSETYSSLTHTSKTQSNANTSSTPL